MPISSSSAKSGKPLIAYLKTPSAREYYLATACSKIYMAPVDLLDLKGVAFETLYFKNTLDKLGVQVDVEHAGKYKDYGGHVHQNLHEPPDPRSNEQPGGRALRRSDPDHRHRP